MDDAPIFMAPCFRRGPQALAGDGSFRSMEESISPILLQSLTTRAGGEHDAVQ